MAESPGENSQTATCPICGSRARHFCSKHGCGRDWVIERCTACGHGFVSNRPSPDDLGGFYEKRQEEIPMGAISEADLRDLPACRELAERIASLTSERGATLDVGCGRGGFSYHLALQGFSPNVLNDLDPTGEKALALLPSGEFHQGRFEDLDHPGPFSAIVMSQVLEHTLDPADWLRRSRNLLSRNGVLAIALPNFAGVYHLMGSRDPFLIPPFHLNYFTPRSLRMAMEQAGLEILSMDSRSRVNVTGRFRPRGIALRRAVVACWNAASSVLNPTTRGVILRAFARPRSEESAAASR